jgi:hypothetical protein
MTEARNALAHSLAMLEGFFAHYRGTFESKSTLETLLARVERFGVAGGSD